MTTSTPLTEYNEQNLEARKTIRSLIADVDRSKTNPTLEQSFGTFLDFLGHQGDEPIYLQVIGPRNDLRGSATAVATSRAQAIGLLHSAESYEATGDFIIPNRAKRGVETKYKRDQWVVDAKGEAFGDRDVSARRVILIDADAVRDDGDGPITGVSATAKERAASIRVTLDIADRLTQIMGTDAALGWGMSGNGGHVYVALDGLGEDAETPIKELLSILAAVYDTDGVHIDTGVTDAKRLVPAFGSLKRKGQNVKGVRPWRRTWFVSPALANGGQVKRIGLDDLTHLVSVLRADLTPEQREKLEAKNTKKAVTKPASPDKDGPSWYDMANALPYAEVMAKMSLSAETCPGCKIEGKDGGVKGNVYHCFRTVKCPGNIHSGDPSKKRNWSCVDAVACFKNVTPKEAAKEICLAFGLIEEKHSKRRRARGNVVPLFDESVLDGISVPEAKPVIRHGVDTHRVIQEAVQALAKDPDVYARAGVLAHILPSADGPEIKAIPLSVLSDVYLARCARWAAKDRCGEWIEAQPLGSKAIHEYGYWPEVRGLKGIVNHPVMRRDGSVLTEPGYDTATQLIYQPSSAFPAIPESPTRDEAIKAAEYVMTEVMGDFPLIPSGKGAWLSMLLTYFARCMFDGPSPGYVIDATSAGTGKGLCAAVTGIICLGHAIPVTAAGAKEEETRKSITSALMAGRRMMLVDNLRLGSQFGGPTWDTFLTCEIWIDRILGVSQEVKITNECLTLINGNNVQLMGDTIRRMIHIRMETDLENPEARSEFRHPDLVSWTRENRSQLVAAMLTIIRAWHVAGRPQHGVRLGSFEGWARTVGSIVAWLGLGDVTKTQGEYRDRCSSTTGDASVLRPLMNAWAHHLGDQAVTLSHVLGLITREDQRVQLAKRGMGGEDVDLSDLDHAYQDLREAILGLCPKGLPTALGFNKRLQSYMKKNVDGRWFLPQGKERTGAQLYALVPVQSAEVCRGLQRLNEGQPLHTFASNNNHLSGVAEVAEVDLEVTREKNTQQTADDDMPELDLDAYVIEERQADQPLQPLQGGLSAQNDDRKGAEVGETRTSANLCNLCRVPCHSRVTALGLWDVMTQGAPPSSQYASDGAVLELEGSDIIVRSSEPQTVSHVAAAVQRCLDYYLSQPEDEDED